MLFLWQVETNAPATILSLSGVQVQFGNRNLRRRPLIEHPEGLSDDRVVLDRNSMTIAEYKNGRSGRRFRGRWYLNRRLPRYLQRLFLAKLLDFLRQPPHLIGKLDFVLAHYGRLWRWSNHIRRL